MADQSGLVLQGDDGANILTVKLVHEEDGDRSIYNVIHGAGGDDTLIGTPFKGASTIAHYGVQLFGDDGSDDIKGSKGADTLSGGSGDDIIYYSGGADTVDGGSGFDSFQIGSALPYNLNHLTMTHVEEIVVEGNGDVGNFDLNSVGSIRPDSSFSDDAPQELDFSQQANIRSIQFLGTYGWLFNGSKSGDHFDLSASSVYFHLYAGKGDDLVIGGSGINQILGEGGNDKLIGGADKDDFDGGVGNDILRGNGGDDSLAAGTGNDTVFGNDGNDFISTGSGDDVIRGGSGDDTIDGSDDNQPPSKASDFKILDGGDGDDVFQGFVVNGQSISRFIGGAGTDTVKIVGDISHLVFKSVEVLDVASDGTSEKSLTIAPDVLDSFDRLLHTNDGLGFLLQLSASGDFTWKSGFADPGNATLVGSNRDDHIDMSDARGAWTIQGGAGDDTIIGLRKENDWLYGGDGDDTLIGTAGFDYFEGGKGKDTFVFSNTRGETEISDFTTKGASHDIIDLSAVSSLKGFDDLMAHHSVQHDDYLAIWFGHNAIALNGLTVKDLDASDFRF